MSGTEYCFVSSIELTKQYSVPDTVYNDLYIVEVINAATNYLKHGANQVAVEYSVAAHQLIKDIELTEAQATAVAWASVSSMSLIN